jgi:hypothetical protein
MVIAGIKNRKIQGAMVNKDERLAKPESRMFIVPGKTHVNSPFRVKKIMITIYPVKELKKLAISF